jgi:hypothetical protein
MSPGPRRQVSVKAQREAQVDFALIQGGRISGHVFIDANGDGVFQDLEEPLEGIAVVLQPGDEFRRTDADGAFVFEEIMPGDYALSVHAKDLPGGYALASSEPMPVAIDTAEDVAGADFPVRIETESVQQFPAKDGAAPAEAAP